MVNKPQAILTTVTFTHIFYTFQSIYFVKNAVFTQQSTDF